MADTFSPLLNLRLQQTGNNQNTWGDLLNTDTITPIENAIAGRNVHTVTGGTLDLSATPLVEQVHVFTGTLTSDQTVIVPTSSKRMLVQNGCAGSFALLMKITCGTIIGIPAGTTKDIVVNSGNAVRLDTPEVGEIKFFGRTSAPSGYLVCDGSAISRTQYPDLFAAISTTWGAGNGATTFNIPDGQSSNRFIRSSGGSLTVGTVQSQDIAAHNHTASASTSVGLTITTDGSHQHTLHVSDPGHTHSPTAGTAFISFAASPSNMTIGVGANGSGTSSTSSVASSTTGVGVTEDAAGSHFHSGSSASASTSVTVNNSTGTETRPNNLVALMCIRY